MSDATKSVAESVVADMFNQAAGKGMPMTEENAAVLAAAQEEAPAAPEESPPALPTAAEEVYEEAQEALGEKFLEMPSFAPVPDEEFAGFEEEEAEKTIAELREALDDEDNYEVEDADELRAKVHKLEKALNYQRELRAKTERGRWESEAKEKYPLANVGQINAQSRNGFMKAAAQSHNDNYSHLAPFIEGLEEYRAQLAEKAKSEGRQAAVEAWGQPSTQPSVGQIDEAEYERGLAEVRKTRSLEKVLRFKREHGR